MNNRNACDEKEIGRKNRRDTLIVIGVVVVMIAVAFAVVKWIYPRVSPGYYMRDPYKRQEYILDDYVTITAYGKDQAQVEGAVDAAFQEIGRVQDVADRYSPESEVARVNEQAAAGPVAVSDDLWEMIAGGMKVFRDSGGLFDITIGPLVDVWDVVGRGERNDPPPSDAEIERAKELVGADKLVLDEAAHSVYFTREGMVMDLGGLAKGYALDRAEEALRSGGVESAVINMISTSLTIGDKPESAAGPEWYIAIENPRGEGYMGTLLLPGDTLISTSGDYQRFFEYDGVRYHHIIDPHTGYPARGSISVTLIGGESGAWSDAASTAAFVMGYPESMDWIEGIADTEAVIVDADGFVHATPGLESRLESLEEKVQ